VFPTHKIICVRFYALSAPVSSARAFRFNVSHFRAITRGPLGQSAFLVRLPKKDGESERKKRARLASRYFALLLLAFPLSRIRGALNDELHDAT